MLTGVFYFKPVRYSRRGTLVSKTSSQDEEVRILQPVPVYVGNVEGKIRRCWAIYRRREVQGKPYNGMPAGSDYFVGVAEWLRSGLQIHVYRFDSCRPLQIRLTGYVLSRTIKEVS